jgi:hypothetical protein
MGMSKFRRLATTAGITLVILVLGASAAFAHDCFNPQKNVHAPTAGVNYTITSFEPFTIVQTGPGKGIGGFVAIAPSASGLDFTVYAHSIGNSNSHETVGGPGSKKLNHMCDGKGIDYLDCLFAGG